MAKHIEAVSEYRPRIDLNELVGTSEIARYIARGTALNHGEILNVLKELNEAVVFFALQGTPVKIADLGVFRPSIRLNGRFEVSLRIDPSIRRAINVPGEFNGTLINPANIGLLTADLIERWNTEHPDDPVEA